MKQAKGLMGFWADIDPPYIQEYRRWHNCEHMLERVSIPGFISGRRYCGVGDAAMFFMYYETETPDVLASDAYHAALNSPTPWTGEALKHFRNPARNIYRLIESAGSALRDAQPFVATIRFNLAGNDASIVQDYVSKTLPELAARPEFKRVRLWQVDEGISGIMTSERKIYGGGPGSQKYLLLMELMAELPAMEPAKLPGLTPTSVEKHRDIFTEGGWLDFALQSPDANTKPA